MLQKLFCLFWEQVGLCFFCVWLQGIYVNDSQKCIYIMTVVLVFSRKKKYFEANSSTLYTKVLRQLKYISVKNGLGINLDIVFQPISTFMLRIFYFNGHRISSRNVSFWRKKMSKLSYIKYTPFHIPYQASKHEYEIGHAKK